MGTNAPSLVLLATLAACGSERSSSGATGSAAASSSATSEVDALAGPLTGKRLLEAKDMVRPSQDWAPAQAKLERFLGKPTRVEGKQHSWAVVEGDSCTYFTVEKEDRAKFEPGKTGDMVGMVTTPYAVDKDGPPGNRAECLEIAGKSGIVADDPNAEGPPSDGAVIPLAAFQDKAVKGRSKWKGQRVKVSALLFSVGTWKDGDVERVDVSLVPARDKTDDSVSCSFKKGAPKPETLMQFTPLTAEGTVEVSKWVSGAGTSGMRASLRDCTLSFDAAPAVSASAGPINPKRL